MPSRLSHLALAAILVCMGALYLHGLGRHGMFMWDEAHYAVLGRALADGEGYVVPAGTPERLRPPVLPAAVALVLTFAPAASDADLLAITVAAALLCTTVIYACTRRETGGSAALAAALLFVSFPEMLRSTSYLLTEVPFMLFYTPAVLYFHRGVNSDARAFLIAWPCWALALATRYTAVLFAPTCLLIAALPLLAGDRSVIARLRSRSFLLGAALAALIVAPILARAWLLFDDPFLGFRAAARQLPDYSQHGRMPVHYYATQLPAIIGWLPALALPAAVAIAILRRDRFALSCAIAAAVIPLWLSRYGWKEPRLVSAALPFVAIVIGVGAQHMWTATRPSRAPAGDGGRWIPAVAVALALALAIQVDPSYGRAVRQISHSVTLGFPSFLNAMEKARRETQPSAVLVGPNCYQIAWYARRTCRPTAKTPPTPEEAATLFQGVEFFVITSFERSQPRWAGQLLPRLKARYDDRVSVFRDGQFWTALVPGRLVAEWYATTDGAASGDATGSAGASPSRESALPEDSGR